MKRRDPRSFSSERRRRKRRAEKGIKGKGWGSLDRMARSTFQAQLLDTSGSRGDPDRNSNRDQGREQERGRAEGHFSWQEQEETEMRERQSAIGHG
jgi:hypothetical protein